MNDDLTTFFRAVQTDESLPAEVRASAVRLDLVSRSTFDQSYLEFLEEQIALELRGPEWTQVVKARLAALTPYLDVLTLVGFVPTDAGLWSIRVAPKEAKVIHGELMF